MTRHHPDFAEFFEWDEGNEAELAAHRISPDEVSDVWLNYPIWVPNVGHRAGDWKMIGSTNAGRRITVVVRYNEDRRSVRPVTGWDCTKQERSSHFGEGDR